MFGVQAQNKKQKENNHMKKEMDSSPTESPDQNPVLGDTFIVVSWEPLIKART